jgi:hypothetical protein
MNKPLAAVMLGFLSFTFMLSVGEPPPQGTQQEKSSAGAIDGQLRDVLDIGEPASCGDVLLGVYEERIFGVHTYDKWKHCYASCLIARKCDPRFAGFVGILKEVLDLVGTVAYRVATKAHAPSIFIRAAASLRGDPDIMDLAADVRGLMCSVAETSCTACCDRVFP